MLLRCGYYGVISFYYIFLITYNKKSLQMSYPMFRDKVADYSPGMRYLTYWNAIFQSTYFILSFICCVSGIDKKYEMVRRIKSLILTSVIFPLSIFISLTFWSLYTWNKDFIFPKDFQRTMPEWLNTCMHTHIAFLALIECICRPLAYPSRRAGSGYWVYPFLHKISLFARILFYVFSSSVAYVAYAMGHALNRMVWKQQSVNKAR